MEQKIEIWLIRHGKTPENEQHRYIGWLDSSLGSAGKAELIRASETVSKVWVTNRRRTQETAQILFPGAEQILVPGLEEMNFGSFEGKNFEEMQNDSAYRSWVESGCLDVCPGGESKAVFCSRVCSAFLELTQGWQQKEPQAVYPVVAHGGTQMALLEQFGRTDAGRGRLEACLGKRKALDKGAAFVSQAAGKERKKMRIAAAVLCGFFMDLCLGDPDWMPHPVIYMGKAISALEKFLRRKFPDTQKGLLMAGAVLAAILPLGSFLMAAAAIYLAGLVHPVLAFLLETLWCWQALAVKGLYTESMRVKKKLEEQDLPGARSAVARIVGRDTQNLDAAGVAKAAIETVAENFSDGVAAPLFYLVIGGAPLGLCYKAINTMDSMVGYKNDRYLYFGRAAAKLDDVANYIPARISAFLMMFAALLTGQNAKHAFQIWKRDRYNHASPNSAQTESVAAGALDILLAGDAWYFGKLVKKPTIGENLRPVEAADIMRINRMMITASLIALVLFLAVRCVLCILL